MSLSPRGLARIRLGYASGYRSYNRGRHAQGRVYSKHLLLRAIFITFDEGGGYYDSGYVQPLDFFGDGTRISLIIVSPFVKREYISHQ
jgi:hypothetical protein